MLQTNRVLLEGYLKRHLNLYATVIRPNEEEYEFTLKISRKELLEKYGDKDIRVIITDSYPEREEWKVGVLYVLKTGKVIYYKEKESLISWLE